MPAREKVVDELHDWMRDQIGVRERPHGSNRQKFGRRYGWNGVAWCVQFAWCGCQAIRLPSRYFPKTAAVAAVKAFAIKNGRWGHRPRVGAFGLYPGGASHIFWVEKILSGDRVQTIEGNTNNDGSREGYGVFRRIRSASNVGGYFYPRYVKANLRGKPAGDTERAATTDAPVKPALARILKHRTAQPMRGADVARLQRRLKIDVDGEFGPDTDAAVREFQQRCGLHIDGDVGPDTAKALGFRWTGAA